MEVQQQASIGAGDICFCTPRDGSADGQKPEDQIALSFASDQLEPESDKSVVENDKNANITDIAVRKLKEEIQVGSRLREKAAGNFNKFLCAFVENVRRKRFVQEEVRKRRKQADRATVVLRRVAEGRKQRGCTSPNGGPVEGQAYSDLVAAGGSNADRV